MITWLSSNDFIMSTTLLIPFFIFWGLSFAHHVGLLILAHLTQSGFPSLSHHPLLILSVLGSLDANLANVGYGFQGSSGSAAVVVAGSLVAAVGVYGHFIWEVIGDICRFYDMK
jgi:ethanolaminephosphotransferase